MTKPTLVRTMSRAELDLAVEWATAEGWNPGLQDATAFHAADPGAFLVACRDDHPAAPATDMQRLFGVTTFELG
jgi:hypothetical protein